jgi:hypothetical protein
MRSGGIAPYILNLGTRGVSGQLFDPGALPRAWYELVSRLRGSLNRYGRGGEQDILFPAGNRTRVFRLVA